MIEVPHLQVFSLCKCIITAVFQTFIIALMLLNISECCVPSRENESQFLFCTFGERVLTVYSHILLIMKHPSIDWNNGHKTKPPIIWPEEKITKNKIVKVIENYCVKLKQRIQHPHPTGSQNHEVFLLKKKLLQFISGQVSKL